MILEKNVGYHHLTFYLLQPNPTLLDTITSDLKKVRGLRNPMTTTHGDPQGKVGSHPTMRNRSAMTSRPGG
jgi:hypothetical protein